MRATYIKPETDITVLKLVNSVLDSIGVIDPSYRSGEGMGNEITFDDESDEDALPGKTSLWD